VRNDSSVQEHPETPLARRCGYCGDPLFSQRKGAKYCSRDHKELARAARKRASDRLTTLRSRHPFPDEFDPSPPPESGREDRIGDQDDEAGIHAYDAPDPGREADERYRRTRAFYAAVAAIDAEFEARARPYAAQQKRNPGPLRPELATLARERDRKVQELTRAHQHAEALEWAARRQPLSLVSAHERADEQAAARAFAADLGRGRYLPSGPGQAGRPTEDIAVW
jgi:hypothetical protein